MNTIAKFLTGTMLASMMLLTGCNANVETHETVSNVTETTDADGNTTTVTEETVDGKTTVTTVVTDKDGNEVSKDVEEK